MEVEQADFWLCLTIRQHRTQKEFSKGTTCKLRCPLSLHGDDECWYTEMATVGTLRWPLLPPFLKEQAERRELLYHLNAEIVLALCLASACPKGVFLCNLLRTVTENCNLTKN